MADQPGSKKWHRVLCYVYMGLIGPAILFAFALVFGNDSYQWWGDRFHLELSNRYVFARGDSGTLLGALWREDILSGSPWATNISPAPLALAIVLARIFKLSPFGIDLAGALILYFIAVASMYIYLRRVLVLGIESATATAVMFAGTTYWISHLVGSSDLPIALACLPALLFMAHRIHCATESEKRSWVLLCSIGFAVLFFVFTFHSAPASSPIIPMLVVAYVWAVFGLGRAFWWCLSAIVVGFILYLPFLWTVVDATHSSSRFTGEIFFAGGQVPIGISGWLLEARLIAVRLAIGHNAHGVYLVAILGFLMWWVLGPRMSAERPPLNRILKFAAWAAIVIPLIQIFHLSIDYLKRGIPLIGGWSVSRFQYMSSFAILTLVAWMLDRSVFRSDGEPLSSRQRVAVRIWLVVTGIIGACQIGYSAYRMNQVPSSIYPQNIMLYGGLALYAATTIALLVWLYRETWNPPHLPCVGATEFRRLGMVSLIVAAVSLTTSVHAYRQGVVGMRGTDMKLIADPVMTYRERYSIPDEILAIKRLNVTDGRVVDLTRPFVTTAVGPTGDAPLVQLGGLRTPSGYNPAYPAWYDRFIYIGIDGVPVGPRGTAQVLDTGRTNFEALGLLDVEYVLAPAGAQIPGYAPIPNVKFPGKTLFGVADGSRVGPAFMSPGVACFASDEEALDYIHRAGLRDLQDRAVLVASDPHAGPLCRKQRDSQTERLPESVRVQRGTDRVTVQVETSMGGILTLADTYYPGWKVLVNGAERPLLRTYTTLRGVVIEPGRQVVEFIYDPKVFWFLFHLSNAVLGFLLLATLAVWLQEQFLAKRKLRTQGEAGL